MLHLHFDGAKYDDQKLAASLPLSDLAIVQPFKALVSGWWAAMMTVMRRKLPSVLTKVLR